VCAYSELWVTARPFGELGVVPCAVGAPYAVLVAEELHASGCDLLVSVTSAGQILELATPPYFVLITRAWRDEGTSLHYQPASEWSELRADLASTIDGAFADLDEPVFTGQSWTTDAPLRETPSAIERARSNGVHAVEMEAAALYAFAKARVRSAVCIAHVTNQMGRVEGDFEKGAADGAEESLKVISLIACRWRAECR